MLLRIAAGAALVFFGLITWLESQEPKVFILLVAAVSVACGLFLLLGLFTKLASMFGALICLSNVFSIMSLPLNVTTSKLPAVFTTMIAIAVACLGPGAYSLDARRHGRREIIIPARHRPSGDGPQ